MSGAPPCPRCGYPDAIADPGRLARAAAELNEEYDPLVRVSVTGGALRAEVADCSYPDFTAVSGDGMRELLDAALPSCVVGTAVRRRAARAARAQEGERP